MDARRNESSTLSRSSEEKTVAAASTEGKRPWLSMSTLFADIDEQWPSLKFLGFGCYYAWIWLCYDSEVLVPDWMQDQAAYSVFDMYLLSTTALALVLIVSSLFASKVEAVLRRSSIVFAAGALATVSTVGVVFGGGGPAFTIFSALTGVGTAWIALRLGMVYGTVPARQALMYTAAAFVFAGMLYFVAVGLPGIAGILFAAFLPTMAALCSVATLARTDAARSDCRPTGSLPHGFFARFVLAVAVFAVVVGVTRGYSTLSGGVDVLSSNGVIIAAVTACIAAILFLVAGMLMRDFDVSKLYYPATILVSGGVLVTPVISSATGGASAGAFEGQVIGVAYVLFVMVIWCLCAHVSYMTDLSPVRVFGWGRGASAAGTTLGWVLGSMLLERTGDNPSVIVAVSIMMVFVLLIVVMLVFNDRAIGRVLRQANGLERAEADAFGNIFPDGMVEGAGAPNEGDGASRPQGAWTRACNLIADDGGLSARERDVLFLLAKGRSIEYVHEELGISVNTAKTHIKNVYAKLGVHTRQELLDMVEGAVDEQRR